MVRPAIAPSNRGVRVAFMSAGSAQLLVGPASSGRAEQMKVRSSTRATSAGCERTSTLLGRSSPLSGMAVPAWTISLIISSCSAWEPSHHWTRSGLVRAATSPTHASSFWLCIMSSTPGVHAIRGGMPSRLSLGAV